ncbi:hypothetical protein C8Q70DRAFT_314469 [Cubamyces menziesii]|nr:hypothetical protein C8Q70DRAFT_314469 [Cubamyces menziesii]
MRVKVCVLWSSLDGSWLALGRRCVANAKSFTTSTRPTNSSSHQDADVQTAVPPSAPILRDMRRGRAGSTAHADCSHNLRASGGGSEEEARDVAS